MTNKIKLIKDKINTLDQFNSAIETIEGHNKENFTIAMYFEDYYSPWTSNQNKETRGFNIDLERKMREIYLSELRKKKVEVEAFINQSIQVEEGEND